MHHRVGIEGEQQGTRGDDCGSRTSDMMMDRKDWGLAEEWKRETQLRQDRCRHVKSGKDDKSHGECR